MVRRKPTLMFLLVTVLMLLFNDASRTPASPLLFAEGGSPGSQDAPAEAAPQQEIPILDTQNDAAPSQPEPQIENTPEQQDRTTIEEVPSPEPESEPEPDPVLTPEPATQPSSTQ